MLLPHYPQVTGRGWRQRATAAVEHRNGSFLFPLATLVSIAMKCTSLHFGRRRRCCVGCGFIGFCFLSTDEDDALRRAVVCFFGGSRGFAGGNWLGVEGSRLPRRELFPGHHRCCRVICKCGQSCGKNQRRAKGGELPGCWTMFEVPHDVSFHGLRAADGSHCMRLHPDRDRNRSRWIICWRQRPHTHGIACARRTNPRMTHGCWIFPETVVWKRAGLGCPERP